MKTLSKIISDIIFWGIIASFTVSYFYDYANYKKQLESCDQEQGFLVKTGYSNNQWKCLVIHNWCMPLDKAFHLPKGKL